MTDCTVDPTTVQAHERALAAAAGEVGAAGQASAVRLDSMDFGALFADWLVPMVNESLQQVTDSVNRYRAAYEEHQKSFRANITANTATDRAGAAAVTDVGTR